MYHSAIKQRLVASKLLHTQTADINLQRRFALVSKIGIYWAQKAPNTLVDAFNKLNFLFLFHVLCQRRLEMAWWYRHLLKYKMSFTFDTLKENRFGGGSGLLRINGTLLLFQFGPPTIL